jgi:hypothetical protein
VPLQYWASFRFSLTHSSASFRESRIVHQLSRQSSKLSNFSEKGTQIRDDRAAVDMYCRLINMYRTYHQPSATLGKKVIRRLNIEGSVKQIRGTWCIKFGLNEGVRSVNADQSVAWSGTEVVMLMTCSDASNDTTNIHPGQVPISYDDPRGWTRPELESRSGGCSYELY